MQAREQYQIHLHLFDHAHARYSPLLTSKTASGLPRELDSVLTSTRARLHLPRTSLWDEPLPRTRELELRDEGRASTQADEWRAIVEQARPLDADTSAAAARIDWRFGPLSIDWIDGPKRSESLYSPAMASTSSSSARRGELDGESSGSADVNFGVVHLFRELGAQDGEPESTEMAKQRSYERDGTVVGCVAVPGTLTTPAFLSFVNPALDSVAQIRILRDSNVHRFIVLMRFRSARDADEFQRVFNGKPYRDTKDSEVCQVVSITRIKLSASSLPPFNFPYITAAGSDVENSPSLRELPTCPVCLERMDASATGLITIVCQHTYHCSCLIKWGDSRCPVCRATNLRTRRPTLRSSNASHHCSICQSTANLWTCLICANVGCGRYQGGHANLHFNETGHAYAMELATERVWDYVGDAYVHRLITNQSDGRVVELPPAAAAGPSGGATGSKLGPDADDVESQDKLEAMGIQYAYLMASQLEAQRTFYEEEVARAKDETLTAQRRMDEERRRVHELKEATVYSAKEREEMAKRLSESEARHQKDLDQLKARIDEAERSSASGDATRRKERQELQKQRRDLEKQLESERAVSQSLSENMTKLRVDAECKTTEIEALKNETKELREQVNDLMMTLTFRDKAAEDGSELAGGSVGIVESPASKAKARRKKK